MKRMDIAQVALMAVLVLALGACRCRDSENYDVLIPAGETRFFHYRDGDAASFLHSNGDTLHCVLSPIAASSRQIGGGDGLGEKECDRYFGQRMEAVLEDAAANFEAIVVMQAEYREDSTTSQSVPHGEMKVTVNGLEFSWYPVRDASTAVWNQFSTYHDSLALGGRMYHEVWEMPLSSYPPQGSVTHPSRLWFAGDGGIVRLEYADGRWLERF